MDTEKYKKIAAKCDAKSNRAKEEDNTSRDQLIDSVKAWTEQGNRASIVLLTDEGNRTFGLALNGKGSIIYNMLSSLMEQREDFATLILLISNEYMERHADDEPNANDK